MTRHLVAVTRERQNMAKLQWMFLILTSILPVCLLFSSDRTDVRSNEIRREPRQDLELPIALQLAADLVFSLTGFVNDAYGVYIIASSLMPNFTLSSGVEPSDSSGGAPSWSFRIQDELSNSTERLAHRVIHSSYFPDEKAILDSFRLLAQDKDRFLRSAGYVEDNVLHLLDGMLGLYQYGGDILQTTVDFVQVRWNVPLK